MGRRQVTDPSGRFLQRAIVGVHCPKGKPRSNRNAVGILKACAHLLSFTNNWLRLGISCQCAHTDLYRRFDLQ